MCFRHLDFSCPDDYVEYVREGIRIGKLSFGPSNADELIAVFEALPEFTKTHYLCPNLVRDFGLPADYFDPVEPLSEREQERLLVTLANDDDFRVALRTLLLGGSA